MKIISDKLPAFIKPVDDRLLRGKSVCCPYRLYTMKKNNITQIIDLRNTPSITKYMERFFCKLFGIKYVNCRYPHRLNVLPEERFFKKVNAAIVANNKITYIHCQRGKRRTGVSVAYYEKNVMHLPENKILENLVNNGYKDLNFDTKLGKNIIIY